MEEEEGRGLLRSSRSEVKRHEPMRCKSLNYNKAHSLTVNSTTTSFYLLYPSILINSFKMLIKESYVDVPTKADGKDGSMSSCQPTCNKDTRKLMMVIGIFLFNPSIPGYPQA